MSDNDSEIKAEFTIDEVLCHELIHFGANYRLPTSSRSVEEEIAYGKSIGYLRQRGRTDDFIIEKNMLPYLVGQVDMAEVYRLVLIRHYPEAELAKAAIETLDLLLSQHDKEIRKMQLLKAKEIGRKMIDAYGGGEIIEKPMTRKHLILEDDV